MAFDVEHIACGSFSSLSEGVGSPTSPYIDCGVHASCVAGLTARSVLGVATEEVQWFRLNGWLFV